MRYDGPLLRSLMICDLNSYFLTTNDNPRPPTVKKTNKSDRYYLINLEEIMFIFTN